MSKGRSVDLTVNPEPLLEFCSWNSQRFPEEQRADLPEEESNGL